MKKLILLLLILLVVSVHSNGQQDTLRFAPSGESSDSVEYELIVIDPGYEAYLATQPSMNFYSQHYYENWNLRYVTEWNYRHSQPMRYGDMYQTYIDYRPNIDYGLELNYKLFHYFRFFEKENGVDLLPEKVF
jgi:hypothetical protein